MEQALTPAREACSVFSPGALRLVGRDLVSGRERRDRTPRASAALIPLGPALSGLLGGWERHWRQFGDSMTTFGHGAGTW